MEIIEELEPEQRGIYGGAVGYFAANGSMDTCIALRTTVLKDGVMYVQAGAGIVADSVPESEHQECQHKARALVRAAQEAVRFAATGRGNFLARSIQHARCWMPSSRSMTGTAPPSIRALA